MNKRIRNSFVKQQDQSDCGVACLLSILKYYNSDCSIERIRELSGINQQGTTLLGLYQAANELGFEAKGVKIDISNIEKFQVPSILHIIKENQLQHFIVLFNNFNDKKLIISDPAEGVKIISVDELNEIWKTKYCLLLKPTKNLLHTKQQNKYRQEWFVKFLKQDKNIFISSIFIGIILSILSMVTAILTQKLIDNILPEKKNNILYIVIAFLFFLLTAKSILSYLRNIFLIKQNRNFNNRIVDYFFSALLHLPKVFFDTRSIGDMVARLNDTSRIQKFISHLAGSIIIDALMYIVSLGFIFYYSNIFGIVSLIFFSGYFILIRFQTKTVINKQQNILISHSNVETNYINTIEGISDIKNFNKQSVFINKNSNIYKKYQDSVYQLGVFHAKLNILNSLLSSFFLVSIFGYGAYLVIDEKLKLGVFVAIFGISTSLLPYITNLAMLIIPLNEAKIAFKRMYDFTNIKSECKQKKKNIIFNEIFIKNLSFRFVGHKKLLNNISFNVKLNEIIAIVGENGSGKTTIIQILNKFYNYEKGEIIINNNISFDKIDIEEWRNEIAVVPQNIHIFNGTIIENITMQFGESNFEIYLEILNSLGLLNLFNNHTLGIYTLVGEIGINLSGGQKQIIAIARALIKNPKLLILDEATSAMEGETENFILKLMQEIKHKTAIIFITHRFHILRNLADRIYILEKGNTELYGNHNKLIESDNIYSKFWNKINNSYDNNN